MIDIKNYNIQIKEEFVENFNTTAKDLDHAIEKITKKYHDKKIQLNHDRPNTVGFNIFPSIKLDKNFNIVITYDKKNKLLVMNNILEDGTVSKIAHSNIKTVTDVEGFISNNIYEHIKPEERKEFEINSYER